MKHKAVWSSLLLLSLLALALGGMVQPAAARATAALGEAAAAAECAADYADYGTPTGPDPLSPCQWDMTDIHAEEAWDTATGEGVVVGVIDSGVDFTHPDIVANLDVGLSCSFIYSSTPTADPAEVGNGDCSIKTAVQDLNGHGTHVATTIAAPANGIGIVGVAPDATIVALKACTIEGYCFVDSVAAALRYAGDHGIDVVNLSLFADPYLYYCAPEAEQRAMLRELQDAALYAEQRGVVVVAAAGNETNDLGHPTTDDISPDWPPGAAVERQVGNECRVAPAELPGVVTVSATGVSTLAVYSNFGMPIDVAAPGGDASQTPSSVFGRGRILAGWSSTDVNSWPIYDALGRAVMSGGARYVWVAGTSMASPHAAGVAALIREAFPNLPQAGVAAMLASSATPMDCPADDPGCVGGAGQNSYVGAGLVNAEAAVE